MNQNSRSFKMLSKVLQNEDNGSMTLLQLQSGPELSVTKQPQGMKSVAKQPKNTELSLAIQNLQRECLQAEEVLKENINPNLGNEELVTEIIGLNNTNELEAIIDIDCLNNVTLIEEAHQGIGCQVIDTEENVALENDWEVNKNSNENELADNSSSASLSDDFDKAAQNENVSDENSNKSGSSSTEEVQKLSDKELVISDSNSEEGDAAHEKEDKKTGGGDQLLNQETKKRKRSKNRLSDSRNWEYNINKNKREEGRCYMGRNNNKFTLPRTEKTIKVRCSCREKSCKRQNFTKCYKITEEERQIIFKRFWNFSWEAKKVYITGRTIPSNIKRTRNRKVEGESRRTVSYNFFLDKKHDRVKVCKTMFCNTLGMPMRTITNWIKKGLNSPEAKQSTTENLNNKSPNLDEKSLKKRSVKEFFNSLPKLESHYCRKSSSKLYLEPRWKSKAELYSLYKDSWCKERNIRVVASLTLFKHIFEEINLSLFSPKKDECDICVGYRTKNVSEEIYQEHVVKKNEARAEKEKDKESSNIVFTMDLQSVLLCPQSNVSALYYKTKLIVHNFTIFDLHSKDGYCFLWHEGEGELKANCFASVICNFFITKVLPNIDQENKPKIILYSDGCGAQNRNSTLSNALLNLTIENKICILQKYLEKGHTQMECDSMHSTIERKISRRVINVPADYVHCLKTARKNPKPYEVQYLHNDFFKSFSSVNFVNSIRPGHKVGDPVVQNIRALKYNPEGFIEYKLRHSDTFQQLPVRLNKKSSMIPFKNLPTLYLGKLKIKQEKFEHLQSLKNTMEQDYHNFYDTLEHD